MKIDDLCVVCQPHPQVEWTDSGLEKKYSYSYFLHEWKKIMKACYYFQILLEVRYTAIVAGWWKSSIFFGSYNPCKGDSGNGRGVSGGFWVVVS